MAQPQTLIARVKKLLADTKNVTEKNMFGKRAFLVNDKMCICANDNELMCRVDPALQDTLLTKQGCGPVEMRGKLTKGYFYVDKKAVETEHELQYWVSLALDFNSKAKSSKKAKTKLI